MNEIPSPAQPESEPPHDLELDLVPAELGFVETEELIEIREQLRLAYEYRDDDGAIDKLGIDWLLLRYHEIGITVVEQQQDKGFSRAQLGLMVAMALLRRDVGRIDHYIEDLEEALEPVEQAGYLTAALVIEAAIAAATEA